MRVLKELSANLVPATVLKRMDCGLDTNPVASRTVAKSPGIAELDIWTTDVWPFCRPEALIWTTEVLSFTMGVPISL
jgi:predicted lipoprotein